MYSNAGLTPIQYIIYRVEREIIVQHFKQGDKSDKDKNIKQE